MEGEQPERLAQGCRDTKAHSQPDTGAFGTWGGKTWPGELAGASGSFCWLKETEWMV